MALLFNLRGIQILFSSICLRVPLLTGTTPSSQLLLISSKSSHDNIYQGKHLTSTLPPHPNCPPQDARGGRR